MIVITQDTDCSGQLYQEPLNRRDYMMWCGNFNHHHPILDEERNSLLFMAKALNKAGELLSMVVDHNMDMALPKDILMLKAKSTKNWTRPDIIFCSIGLLNSIVSCNTDPKQRGPGEYHVPILVSLDLQMRKATVAATYNFWGAGGLSSGSTWRLVWVTLGGLEMEAQLQRAASGLTGAIQDMIRNTVTVLRPAPHTQCWWSNKLSELKKGKKQTMQYVISLQNFTRAPLTQATQGS